MNIKIEKSYESLNAYYVSGEKGTTLERIGYKYEYQCAQLYRNYDVYGFINGKFVAVQCKNYRSAKSLFMAMEQ